MEEFNNEDITKSKRGNKLVLLYLIGRIVLFFLLLPILSGFWPVKNIKARHYSSGLFAYNAAAFFWKKSFNFFLVRNVSTILRIIFFFRFEFLNQVKPAPKPEEQATILFKMFTYFKNAVYKSGSS